uniref:Uncharacterized protein n=1 Tax=Globisporangium ultimum (strain ATCC 200006 / CBS 805.95 / DAOM BR144) TaxID=431595 RepID=K3WLJ1_GLOUD
MIDRRYHRSLQLFTWGACAAMTTKLVFFTDYSTRRGREHPHVFTDIQKFADKKLDEFFGVDSIVASSKDQQPPAAPKAPAPPSTKE